MKYTRDAKRKRRQRTLETLSAISDKLFCPYCGHQGDKHPFGVYEGFQCGKCGGAFTFYPLEIYISSLDDWIAKELKEHSIEEKEGEILRFIRDAEKEIANGEEAGANVSSSISLANDSRLALTEGKLSKARDLALRAFSEARSARLQIR